MAKYVKFEDTVHSICRNEDWDHVETTLTTKRGIGSNRLDDVDSFNHNVYASLPEVEDLVTYGKYVIDITDAKAYTASLNVKYTDKGYFRYLKASNRSCESGKPLTFHKAKTLPEEIQKLVGHKFCYLSEFPKELLKHVDLSGIAKKGCGIVYEPGVGDEYAKLLNPKKAYDITNIIMRYGVMIEAENLKKMQKEIEDYLNSTV